MLVKADKGLANFSFFKFVIKYKSIDTESGLNRREFKFSIDI